MTSIEIKTTFGTATAESKLLSEVAEVSLRRAGIILHQIELERPFRVAILGLIMQKKKGCKDWTKLMRLRYGTTEGIECREQIWQDAEYKILGQHICQHYQAQI